MTSTEPTTRIIQCPHYWIWRENNVVLTKSIGTWERLITERFCRDFAKVRKPLEGQSWAVIYHTLEYVLGTPDLAEPLIQLSKENHVFGLTLSVKVVSDSTLKQYQFSSINKAFPGRPEPAKSFLNEDDAFQYLANRGFITQSKSFHSAPG